MPQIELLHTDCMAYMAGLPDKAYDLAIVDPPYGIGGGDYGKNGGIAKSTYVRQGKPDYDTIRPNADYFNELLRVSSSQIIWGGNHFADLLPASPAWVVWNKEIAAGLSLSACELAWTNIGGRVAMYTQMWAGMWRKGEMAGRSPYGERIHPNQKPVALYRWLLQNYAKPGERILDTHLGSGSIAIACDIEGYDPVGCEIDADYIKAAGHRLAVHQSAPRLFEPEVRTAAEQLSLVINVPPL